MTKPINVAVEKINPPVVDVAELNNIQLPSAAVVKSSLKALGMTHLTPTSILAMKTLGLHIKGVGVLDISQGGLMVTQAWMDEMLASIAKKASKTKNAKSLAMLGRTAALIAGKKTEAGKVMLDAGGFRRGTGEDDIPAAPKNKGPTPGMVVQINVGKDSQVSVQEKTLAPEPAKS
jgi:hypothetical protein